jgi:hypothetical protein
LAWRFYSVIELLIFNVNEIRWQIAPAGMAQINNVEADQFSVYIRHLPENSSFVDQQTVTSVLNPGKPKKNQKLANAWNWGITGNNNFTINFMTIS